MASTSECYCCFSQCGEVRDLAILRDRSSGKSRGCAFVSYQHLEEAEAAIAKFDRQLLLPGAQAPLEVGPGGSRGVSSMGGSKGGRLHVQVRACRDTGAGRAAQSGSRRQQMLRTRAKWCRVTSLQPRASCARRLFCVAACRSGLQRPTRTCRLAAAPAATGSSSSRVYHSRSG